METAAYMGTRSGSRLMVIFLASMALGLLGILLASGAAQAHDHQIPNTVLKKGAKELQAGTLVKESSWNAPAGGNECVNESAIYRTRFPEADIVAAGAKLRVRVSKAQRPDSFEIAAYRAVDAEGTPIGEGRLLNRTLGRVVRDGKTVAWDAAFSVNGSGRDYYLISEGHWQDREGCERDQYAFWSFHARIPA